MALGELVGRIVDSLSDSKNIGRNFGRYIVEDRLGAGAMGTVWLARDRDLDRLVAIKEPKVDNLTSDVQKQAFTDRFLREAQASARLQHPNVIAIHSVETFDDVPVIIMEYIDGITLGELLKSKELSLALKQSLYSQLLQAVAYAHDNNIVHRDLKPDNVLVTKSGQVKLGDFGIACLLDASIALSKAGETLGTPAYMAPEQLKGEATDARVDVFALGVVAFEMFTRQNPFTGGEETNYWTVMNRIINEGVKDFEELRKTAGDFSYMIERALSQRPEQRFPTAKTMKAEWQDVQTLSGVDLKRALDDIDIFGLPALDPTGPKKPSDTDTVLRDPDVFASAASLEAEKERLKRVADEELQRAKEAAAREAAEKLEAERQRLAEEKRKELEAERIRIEQEAEAKRRKEEAERKAAEEKRKAEEEARRKAAEEAEKKRLEEEAERKRLEEAEAKRKAEKAEAKRLKEEADRKAAEEAEKKRLAEEAEKKRIADEEARKQAEAEKRKLEEELRQAQEEKRLEEEARKKAEEAKAKAEEEIKKKAAEEEKRKKEEAKRQKAQEAKRKKDQAEKRKREEAQKKTEDKPEKAKAKPTTTKPPASKKDAEDKTEPTKEPKTAPTEEKEEDSKKKKRVAFFAMAATLLVAVLGVTLWNNHQNSAIESTAHASVRELFYDDNYTSLAVFSSTEPAQFIQATDLARQNTEGVRNADRQEELNSLITQAEDFWETQLAAHEKVESLWCDYEEGYCPALLPPEEVEGEEESEVYEYACYPRRDVTLEEVTQARELADLVTTPQTRNEKHERIHFIEEELELAGAIRYALAPLTRANNDDETITAIEEMIPGLINRHSRNAFLAEIRQLRADIAERIEQERIAAIDRDLNVLTASTATNAALDPIAERVSALSDEGEKARLNREIERLRAAHQAHINRPPPPPTQPPGPRPDPPSREPIGEWE